MARSYCSARFSSVTRVSGSTSDACDSRPWCRSLRHTDYSLTGINVLQAWVYFPAHDKVLVQVVVSKQSTTSVTGVTNQTMFCRPPLCCTLHRTCHSLQSAGLTWARLLNIASSAHVAQSVFYYLVPHFGSLVPLQKITRCTYHLSQGIGRMSDVLCSVRSELSAECLISTTITLM